MYICIHVYIYIYIYNAYLSLSLSIYIYTYMYRISIKEIKQHDEYAVPMSMRQYTGDFVGWNRPCNAVLFCIIVYV